MDKGHIAYVVCATLHGADSPYPELSETVAGQPVVRRLNRMERVAHAFDGNLVCRRNESLLITFDTATAAIRGSCEMQRRCTGLPQVSGNRFSLQIGIHRTISNAHAQVSEQTLPGGHTAERRDHTRRAGFDAASRLAFVAPEDKIVVSAQVLEALGPAMKQISAPIGSAAADIPAYAFNWQKALTLRVLTPTPSFFSQSTAPSTLVLLQGEKRLELDHPNSVTVFGRNPGSDVVITDHFASRIHAYIRIGPEGCVLTDQSANGTSIRLENGEEFLIKDESFVLKGRGRISFGHRASKGTGDTFEFEVIENQNQEIPLNANSKPYQHPRKVN